MQLIARFVRRKKMQAVGKNLSALSEACRADYDGLRILPIRDCACADGHLRIRFADFVALLFCVYTLLAGDDLFPVRLFFLRRLAEQFKYFAHSSE